MSSDFESYEQDFAVLTAEITGRIGKVPKLIGDEKKQMVANVERQLEEARELLEQMELEVREIPPQSRGMYSSRMRSYKQEMGKLEADFKRSRIAYSDEVRNELLGDDGNSSENQRAHLLDNTERLERSSRRLEAGYQIAVETEQIGQEMLENLSHDREKIQRARERLRETDANLGKSSRILTGMLRSSAAGECASRKLPGLWGCSPFLHPPGAGGGREPRRSKLEHPLPVSPSLRACGATRGCLPAASETELSVPFPAAERHVAPCLLHLVHKDARLSSLGTTQSMRGTLNPKIGMPSLAT
ncbi:vesicle transport through interaction with t-SNAREs homolog 1A isoform X1 [Larus michahellis]|uniref:vesicle transport through interaction with t-SNAREs homolog 1A isoform X1 n=1 Tax=Larus michahellis TaxID=119627 RepID=UPI003D9B98C3